MAPTSVVESLADLEERISNLSSVHDVNRPLENGLSLYEWTFSTCTAFICRSPGDKFSQLQKILLKHVFSESDVQSLIASDIYMFLARLIHPDYRRPMCQLVMNLCKVAPQNLMVKGAALVNRLNDPEINFGNPRYKDILVFE